MRQVRMIVSMSGGGPGGRDWRDYPEGSVLTTDDTEAQDLIRIGLAVTGPAGGQPGTSAAPAPVAAAPPDPGPDAGAAAVPEPPARPDTGISRVSEVSPLAQAAVTSAGQVEAPAEPPAPGSPKQAWIAYAIARGEDPGKAAAMVKADLMSKYGGRL